VRKAEILTQFYTKRAVLIFVTSSPDTVGEDIMFFWLLIHPLRSFVRSSGQILACTIFRERLEQFR